MKRGAETVPRLLAALLCALLFSVLAGEAVAQIPTVTVEADACMITQGETVTWTFTASPAPRADLQVDFSAFISGGGAVVVVPGDLGNTKSVTISANQATATYSARTRTNSSIRRHEKLHLYVSNRKNRSTNPYRINNDRFGEWSSIVYVLEETSPPHASFDCLWTRAAENAGVQNIRARLSSPAPSSGVAVNYSVGGTATSGSDYASLSGSVQAPAGATSVDIPVSIMADAVSEGDETVVLTLTGVSGYALGPRKEHTLYIENDAAPPPAANFASASSRAREGAGRRNVKVNLSSPAASGISMNYKVGGTATFGPDYTSPTVSIKAPAGATSVKIPVSIVDDAVNERDETVIMTLTSGTGYTLGSPKVHTLTITDNDTPEASFASASLRAREGAGRRNVKVNLSPAPAAGISVGYTVSGTATSGADYAALAGSVQAPAGATSVKIPVSIVDDAVKERNETVILTLTSGAGYTLGSPKVHTLTITDNDTPAASFASASSRTAENAGVRNVKVNLSPAPAAGISVGYTVSGTTTSGWDYAPLSGSVHAPAGAASVNIPVSIIDDVLNERDETVILTLASGSGYTLGSPKVHTLTIKGNDTPVASFASASSSAAEDSSRMSVKVILSPAPLSGISVKYAVSGTATSGLDYAALAGSIRAWLGTTNANIPVSLGVNIPVSIIDDAVNERDETVILTLAPGSGYTLGSPKVHTLTIADNDGPEISITGGPAVTEGAAASFTLTASFLPVADLSVNVTVAENGSFLAPGEIGAWRVPMGASGTTTFAVSTDDDSVQEANGSVTATVEIGSGYSAASPPANSATVAVNDNDSPPPPDPVVSISGGPAVTEGEDASFTLTASPAPAADLSVNVTVAETGSFLAERETGARRVTVGASGAATFAVSTTDDSADEANGSVTATVASGSGYAAASPPANSASVAVNDNDNAPPTAVPPPIQPPTSPTHPSTPPLSSPVSASLSIAPNPVSEDASATVTVTLSAALDAAVTIPLALTAGTAEADDYGALASVTITANELSGSGEIAMVPDFDAEDETFTVALGALPTGVSEGSPRSVEVTIADSANEVALEETATSAEPYGDEMPTAFALEQNYPNPFNPSTTIGFSLEKAQRVTLSVYDMLGHEVRALLDGAQPAGRYRIPFDASDLASGTYLYVLRTEEQTAARTMALLK